MLKSAEKPTKNRVHWLLTAALVLAFTLSSNAQSKVAPASVPDVLVTDWDDTVAYMPTKILLFKKSTGEVLEVSTGDFAEQGKYIGESGIYKDYEIRGDDSFKYFRIEGTANDQASYFSEDIQTLLKNSNQKWKAPYFDHLVEALSTPEKAANLFILTARGHSPYEIMLGLQGLKDSIFRTQGIKIHLPPIENLIMVGGGNTPQKKGDEFVKLVRRFAGKKIIIEFADDDIKNIDVVRKAVDAIKDELTIHVVITHVSPEKNTRVFYEPAARKDNSAAPSCVKVLSH